jgi:hypothetical protein
MDSWIIDECSSRKAADGNGHESLSLYSSVRGNQESPNRGI